MKIENSIKFLIEVHNKIRFLAVTLFVVFVFLFPLLKVSAAVITWDRGGGNDNWSTCANWSGDTCPGSSDIATFDSTSNTSSNVDASFAGTVQGINITTGYTSTITLQRNLTVGASDYTQSTGTFDMSSFTLSLIGASDFVTTGGTFNEGTGTLQVGNGSDGASHVINVSSTETFYNLIANIHPGGNLNLSSDTIVVSNTFTHTDGIINSGTINWQGATASQGSLSDGGTAVLNFDGAGAQTYTMNGGEGVVLTFDSAADASDTFVLTTNSALRGLNITSGFSGTVSPTYSGFNLTINGGHFQLGAGTFVAPSGILYMKGEYFAGGQADFIITGGTFDANNGTVSFGNGTGTNVNNVVNVSSTVTFYNMTVNTHPGAYLDLSADTVIIANTFTHSDGAINNGTVNWQGTTGTQGSGSDGGTAVLNFDGAGAQTYTMNGGTGSLLTFNSAEDASDTFVLTANSGLYGLNITSGFSGTISPTYSGYSLTINAGDFQLGGGTFNAPPSMIFLGNSDFLVTGGTYNEGTGTVQFGNGGNFNNHTINVLTSETFYNFTLYEWDGYSVDLSGDSIVVANTYTQTRGNMNNGTINWQGAAATIGAASNGGTAILNYDSASAQTLTVNGGIGPLLTLNSSDDASDSLVLTANSTFYGINITSGFSGTFSPTYNGYGITLGFGDFNMGGGTFNAPPYLKLVSGYPAGTDFTITGGTFNGNSTTLMIGDNATGGTNTINVVSALTVNSLVINPHPIYAINLSGDTLVVLDTYTQTNGFADNGTINWQGTTGTIASGAAGGTAVLNFDTASAQTMTINGGTGPVLTYDSADDASDTFVLTANSGLYGLNITSGFSGTVSPTYNGYDLTTGNGHFQLGAGTFNAPSGSLKIRDLGNFTITGGTFNAGTGTVQSGGGVGDSGAHTFNVPTSVNFYNFIVNNYNTYAANLSGDTFIVANNFTQTDGAINSGTVDVRGNVSVGTLADGGSAILKFSGGANQTYTDLGGNEVDGDVYVDKTNGIVTLASNADWNASGQDLIINNGTLDHGASYNISTNVVNVNGYGSTWLNTGTGDITLAGNVVNNGYIVFDGGGGGCGSSDSIAIVSSSGGTQRTWSGNGISQIYDVSVTDMATTSVTAYSSTNTSNNTWTFSSCLSSFTQNDYRWYDNADSITPGSATAALNTAPQIDGSLPLRLRVNNTIGTADLPTNGETFLLQYSTTTSGPWRELVSDTWWNSSWLNRKVIMLNAKDISTDLTDFPVLIKLNSSNIDYSKTKNAGEDIRFIDSDGTVLSYEIELWDESGDSLIWVKIPQLNSGIFNDYITMYYNNTSASDAQDASSVWSNGYAGVWHMKENPGGSSPQILDSTSNANNGTSNGTMTSSNQVAGIVGYATTFDGVDDYIDIGTGSSINLTGTSATVSMWTKNNVTPAQFDTLFTKVSSTSWNTGYGMFYNGASTINFFVNSYTGNVATANIAPTSWNYVSGVYNGTNILMYVNGVSGTSDSYSGNITSGALSGRISQGGSNAYNVNGIIDELRVSSVARSSDWIKAEYYSIQNGIAKIGGEESTSDYLVYKDNASVSNATTLGSNLLASTDVSASYNENSSNITNPNSATSGQDIEWDFSIDPLNASKEDVYFRFVKRNGLTLENYTRYPRLDVNALINHQTYRWYDNTDAIQPTVSVASEGARANFNGTNPNARLRVNLSATLNALPANKQQFKLQYSTDTNGTWTDIGGSVNWYNSSWQNRKKITLNNTASSENLVDFPILVSLTSNEIDYSKTKNAGEDIRFTDPDGTTLLSYEIEKWDESATSTVWVKVPQINANSATDHIYVYYNNTGASDAQNVNSVWNSNYRFVQHLEESGTCATSFTDSTSNALSGSCNNTPAPTTSGKNGNARDFVPADSDNIILVDATDPTAYTYSMWVKPDDATSRGLFVRTDSGGPTVSYSHELRQTSGGKFEHYFFDGGLKSTTGTTDISAGTWYYVTIAATNSGTGKLYVNGALEGSPAVVSTLWTGGDRYYIGADSGGTTSHADGIIDEVRMSSVERSADWIEAEYVNMNGSMNTYGTEENLPVWIYYDNPTPTDGANISSTLLSTSDRTQSYVESSPTPRNPNVINKNQKGEWDFSLKAFEALDDTVYYFRIVKSDGSLINSYTSYPEVTINRVVVISYGGSGTSVELGSGGGTPVGGGTDQGGTDGGDGSGGGTPTGGGGGQGGGGQSP